MSQYLPAILVFTIFLIAMLFSLLQKNAFLRNMKSIILENKNLNEEEKAKLTQKLIESEEMVVGTISKRILTDIPALLAVTITIVIAVLALSVPNDSFQIPSVLEKAFYIIIAFYFGSIKGANNQNSTDHHKS